MWMLTRRLWKRYFGLGVYVFAVILVPILVIAALRDHPVLHTILFASLFVMVDFALTFATAVLPYSKLNAGQAVRHSWSVIKEQWPACAYYVLVPPLAIQLSLQVLPRDSLDFVAAFAASMVTTAFAFVCKGATMLFYADRYLSEEPTVVDEVL